MAKVTGELERSSFSGQREMKIYPTVEKEQMRGQEVKTERFDPEVQEEG